MKILIFGKNGQVGWELRRSLAPVGDLVALGSDNQDLCGDLTDLKGIAQTIQTVSPDIIVNAAAYTAVDKAESEPGKAMLVNAYAVSVMAEQAKKQNAILVHYSTDYVFDGGGTKPWTETDQPNPLSVYGKAKWEGEKAIQSSGCRHLIFRTSWVYAARGNNFAKTMLRLAKERETLSVVNDQFGAPTGAEFIADATAHAIRAACQNNDLLGCYHLAAAGETSWYDYARFVLNIARQKGVVLKTEPDKITPVSTQNFPTPAQRPLNSRLYTAKFRRNFGLAAPDWESGVTRMIEEIMYFQMQ